MTLKVKVVFESKNVNAPTEPPPYILKALVHSRFVALLFLFMKPNVYFLSAVLSPVPMCKCIPIH